MSHWKYEHSKKKKKGSCNYVYEIFSYIDILTVCSQILSMVIAEDAILLCM